MLRRIWMRNSCFRPTVWHAATIIFLEYFAWGLLTNIGIERLQSSFHDQTFLVNGIVYGIKGLLSFIFAPIVGGLSDVWGRKIFLIITVLFTCLPIPLLLINDVLFFIAISLTGFFSVTFSIVFAYVADITNSISRSWAYGVVSATFAASLITSPIIGTYCSHFYGDETTIKFAILVFFVDILFIIFVVPESLKPRSNDSMIYRKSPEIHIFGVLRRAASDHMLMLLSLTVIFSYLPEAGQYSSLFVYLHMIIKFPLDQVAFFIGAVGTFSVISQTIFLRYLIKKFGVKVSIMIGLCFQFIQLCVYALSTRTILIWIGGVIAALGNISYPAISYFTSLHSNAENQGVFQGVITGMRSLCMGVGPAFFGFIFYIFSIDIEHAQIPKKLDIGSDNSTSVTEERLLPGPPFMFGALMVLIAIVIASFLPSDLNVQFAKGEIKLPKFDHKFSPTESIILKDTENKNLINIPITQ